MAPGKYLFFFFLSYLCLEFACCASLSSNDCGTLEKNNKKVYAICVDLQTINGTFEYDYNAENSSLTVLFTATPPNPKGWILWGINPNHTGLQGAQVIAAFKQNNAVVTRNFDLKSYLIPIPDKVSIEVWGARADEEYGRMKLFASIKLPVNKEAVNLVWQKGSSLTEDNILVQDASNKDNLEVKEGFRLIKSLSSSVNKWRTVHAIISFVCWGVFHQIGLIEARFGKKILPYPLWYYVHICWTSLTSISGLCDVVLGLVIGSKTHGLHFNIHLVVGIILAGFAIVQLSTLVLMPKKDDQNLNYWEVVHIVVGYIISFVAPSNMYSGFKMINAEEKWISRYTGWLITQVVIVVVDLIRKAVKGLKKWTGPADPTEIPYGTVDDKKESGMQPNRLDNK